MTCAALVAVILVIGLIGAGIAVASSRGDGIVDHQVRSFALAGFQEDELDVRPSGRSPGDTFFFQQQLRTFDLTKMLGRFYSTCVLENVKSSLNRCTGTAFLGDGRVELAARFKFTDPLKSIRYAVIGGTGNYDNVVGQAKVTFGCEACPPGTEADTLTLDLIPSFQYP
jgi:hypothetical protein